MTNEEKAELRRLVKRSPALPVSDIARIVGCTEQTVKRYRKALCPPDPDLSDALAYMMTGTRTGRWREPSPEMQNLWPPRPVGKSPLLAMPHGNRPRRMVAEDIVFPGGPAYDAVLELERRDMRWRTDIYLEMARALELGNLKVPDILFMGLDLAKDLKQEIDDVTGISDAMRKPDPD